MDSEFSLYRTTTNACESTYRYNASDGTYKDNYTTTILSSNVTGYMNVPGASGVMRAFNQQPLYVVIEAKKVMDVIVISFLAFCNFFWILMAGCFTDWA